MIRPPGTPPPEPHLNPTRPSTLMLTALLLALVGWVFGARLWSDIELPWYPIATLVLLAAIEAIIARATAARIERRPGTEPVDPLFVARLAALAKASSLTGAVLGGFYLGLLVWLFSQGDEIAAAAEDLPIGVGGVLAGAALMAAALWLEFSCRVPKGPSDGYEDTIDDEATPEV